MGGGVRVVRGKEVVKIEGCGGVMSEYECVMGEV